MSSVATFLPVLSVRISVPVSASITSAPRSTAAMREPVRYAAVGAAGFAPPIGRPRSWKLGAPTSKSAIMRLAITGVAIAAMPSAARPAGTRAVRRERRMRMLERTTRAFGLICMTARHRRIPSGSRLSARRPWPRGCGPRSARSPRSSGRSRVGRGRCTGHRGGARGSASRTTASHRCRARRPQSRRRPPRTPRHRPRTRARPGVVKPGPPTPDMVGSPPCTTKSGTTRWNSSPS